MKLLLERFHGHENPGQAPALLHIFVAYDSPLARQSAQHTTIRLAKELIDDSSVDWTFTSFDDLRAAAFAENAALTAARAGMVVFASADAGDLPFPVKAWIERWLARKGNGDSSLVALVGRSSRLSDGASPAQEYLGGIAREARMNFLVGCFELPAECDRGRTLDISSRANHMSVLMEELLRLPPPPHWGINE